jgi:PD-(D/E)XK nuclease superfamily
MDAVLPKQFSWSYSRLHGYEDCPRRFHETQILKNWGEERSEQLTWGDAVHKAMATALRTGTPLPTTFKIFQHWIDKVARTKGELLVEDDCRWAITRQFVPTPWFSKTAWMRVMADAVKLDGNAALVVDWKTGKSANVDPMQLVITSLMMFLQFPDLLVVRSEFIWLQEDDRTIQTLYRHESADQWAEIIPRVLKMEKAFHAENFPATPNRFCKSWCPVRTCEFHGK